MWSLQQHDNGLYDPESPFGYLLPAHMQMTLLFRLLRNADDSSLMVCTTPGCQFGIHSYKTSKGQ